MVLSQLFGTNGGAADIYQQFPVCPGTNYTFSYWVYASYPLNIIHYNLPGTPTALVEAGAWQQVVIPWTIGATASTASFEMRPQSYQSTTVNYVVFFDDFAMETEADTCTVVA